MGANFPTDGRACEKGNASGAPCLPTEASDRRPSKKLMNDTPTYLEHYKLITGILRFGHQFLPGDL